MFDIGLNGTVPFDNKAYGLCRKTLNGMIRFAHELNWIRILVMALQVKFSKDTDAIQKNYESTRRAAEAEINEDQKKELDSIYYKMHITVIKHVILSSALLSLSLFVFVIIGTLFKRLNAIKGAIGRKLATPAENPLISTLDARNESRGKGCCLNKFHL